MFYFYICAAALFALRYSMSFLPTSLLDAPVLAASNTFIVSSTYICEIILLFYFSNVLRYKFALRKLRNANNGKPLTPPPIPYALPWVGNAPEFLSKKPLHFWSTLFQWFPRTAGACSIVLGGRFTTVLFDPVAIQQVLQDRKLGRENFNMDVLHNALGVSRDESEEFYAYNREVKQGQVAPYQEQEKLNVEYLLKTERVHELTTKFIEVFAYRISGHFTDTNADHEIKLYKWFRTLMFDASTTALLGSKLLELSPDLENLFFQFDSDILGMFFGLPSWLIPKAVSNRGKAVACFRNWHKIIRGDQGIKVVSPDDVGWEPLYGSRLNRARQLFYEKRGFAMKTRSALDLGLVFAIASNAIPASNWMLMHIIDSNRPEKQVSGERSLYEFIMDEIKASQNLDGTFNVPVLISQPILLSTLHEVLRVYVDTLLGRTVSQDFTLALGGHPGPIDEKSELQYNKSIVLSRGTVLMVPTYPAHNHPEVWQNVYSHHPSPDKFYPYRFLTSSPHDTSTKPAFTTAHTTGAFFPFGGGKTLCPGRNFGKQEIMAAVAIALANFEFEFVSYVDADGQDTPGFPGLKDTFPGSSVMTASGDLRLKVKRRK